MFKRLTISQLFVDKKWSREKKNFIHNTTKYADVFEHILPISSTLPNINIIHIQRLLVPYTTYTMQSLLRWSIENSTPLDSAPSDDRPPVERKNLDPAIIDMILGKPDAELMKEDMSVAVDANRSEDDRINALDHLEMASPILF